MTKSSYTVPCSSQFRNSVLALAARRDVNVGDLARSILLVVPIETIDAQPDPGEAPPGDREKIVLKSGPSAGKPWQRKPRLQVRLPKGYDPVSIRKALGLALAMDRKDFEVKIVEPKAYRSMEDSQARMPSLVDALAFQPLQNGVTTREEARYVLGLVPGAPANDQALRARFRALAAIHHPDSGVGDHERMAQLNAAMDILSGG